MIMIDNRLEVYVGLDANGGTVEVYANSTDFENRADNVASIGLAVTIPVEYHEVFKVGES